MNTGVVSNRYAVALLKYVLETGGGQNVCAQAEELLKGKAPDKMAPELERFSQVLSANGRMDLLREILTTFVHLYHQQAGESLATLKTAVPLSGAEKKIASAMGKMLGGKVLMTTQVDPSLLGGFVFTIDDQQMDASVKGQLDLVRRTLLAKNKRIV